MPPGRVIFYKEDDGNVPRIEWLDERSNVGQESVYRPVDKTQEPRHELRRPVAAPLKDGIYELRARENKERLRMLFFFFGRETREFGEAPVYVPRSLPGGFSEVSYISLTEWP